MDEIQRALARAYRGLRDDVNTLAWLHEEEKATQRLYLQTFLWCTTGMDYSVDKFAQDIRSGASPSDATHVGQRTAQGPLDDGGEGQGRG